MESFYQYKKAEINMTLGTDTCPQNIIREMRLAAVLSKIHERFTESTTAADVFTAATVGGAKALGRQDLGRLCSGAKADMVIFFLRRHQDRSSEGPSEEYRLQRQLGRCRHGNNK